jgi:hypothetical protein
MQKTEFETTQKRGRVPGSGRKSMSGTGSSPVLVMRVTAAQKAKVKVKGSAWLRGLIDAA